MSIAQAFALAVQHHQAGRLAEAETIYRQILAAEPQHVGALHLLGVIAHQAGRDDVAVDLMRQASALNPNDPEGLSNLGEVYRTLGRLDEAIAEFRRALEIRPDYAEAHSNLGSALADVDQTDEAIAEYRRALQLKPEIAETHYNLGNALTQKGQYDEAVASYRRALELKPGYASACSNLGNALSKQDRLDDAIVAYRRALELQPDLAQAHFNLGNALKGQGRLDEAIAAYRRMLELQPDSADADGNLGSGLANQGQLDEAIGAHRRARQIAPTSLKAHNNLGNALSQQGRFDEAIASFRRALELRPGFAEAHNNLGNALSQQGRLDEAIASFRRALELRPDFVEAFSNLGNTLSNHGRFEDAVATYRRALELRPDGVEVHCNLLFHLHYAAEPDGEAIFREHCHWDELHARPLATVIAPHANEPNPDRRLRIGYVSPDFRSHSVAFFLEGLLASHDRGEVEVFCYANVLRADAITARFRGHAGHWREITGLADAQAAELIRQDRIDILVDLAGHTARNRLLVFARKPAPVQVSWLGYCDTTGMKAMDYRLSDACADPPGMTEHLVTEQLVRLPDCAWCFRPWKETPPVGDLPVLSKGGVTFGSFNARPKITDEVLALWSRILLEVRGSRLVLKNLSFQDATVQQQVWAGFEKAGVARDRVELLGQNPSLADHLSCYHRVDLALDTFPYHGTTTTCEALWMGVPVITLAGRTHASRVGVSLLSNVGLPELIAHTPEEYIKIAVTLSADLPRLAALRASLRERMVASPLLDAPRFAQNVEAAYRQMWRTWCAHRTSLPPL